MSNIQILPEILSNKIAAGEVVERPASVVKELVENALDAGATRIRIDIENGGRRSIRVTDNGCGMGSDDALLAIERYATSKVRKDADLFSIKTLGFRGEALPSIASVSRFTLVTRDAHADAGIRVFMEGGRIKKVSECGAPHGTTMLVENLFYNTPARRKFMKTVNTEQGHIADTLAGTALGWPSVHFRLTHNGKMVKNWSAAADPADRVADVLGRQLRHQLQIVKYDGAHVDVSGWICSPEVFRSTSRGIFLFVNGRQVKDRVVQHALISGYDGRLMKGRFPVAVLNLTVPFDDVDVNVHPTKHEVRFSQQRAVHDAVQKTVREVLHHADRSKWGKPDQWGTPGPSVSTGTNGVGEPTAAYQAASATVSEAGKPMRAPATVRPAAPPVESPSATRGEPAGNHLAGNRGGAEKMPSDRPVPDAQATLWKTRQFADLVLIGQFHGTYLLCESTEGLIIIDQHAAHERIAFESLKRAAGREQPPSQKKLLPETIELGFKEAEVLMLMMPELRRFGLDIEPFGGNTFLVAAVPVVLDHRPMQPLVQEIVEKTIEIGIGNGMERVMDECLMLMACHTTIRANHPLTREQMTALLKQLDTCENPSHCPHGRPTWIRWPVKDLERAFHRIV
ncbi:MAG: DNA mismatch repair endonuclease MutL [Desulfobacteraceae bacterium]|nr:DNA mismatch repair endonuclease MutL [Desulfobacteraceae bacterium]